jgi:hypothetical protein
MIQFKGDLIILIIFNNAQTIDKAGFCGIQKEIINVFFVHKN